MGYAHYTVVRSDGKTIEAGYGVDAVCEEPGCTEEIDRGLGCLCGTTPGDPEDGCGKYFCGKHLYGANQCGPCSDAADGANEWVHPGTGEEFDLRDDFLPADARYDDRMPVWHHTGEFAPDGAPVLAKIGSHTRLPADSPDRRTLGEGDWVNAALLMYRQSTTTPEASDA